MKKIICLILALTMCLSLCACGSNELTQKEREAIFYEVAKEKGLYEYVVGYDSGSTAVYSGLPGVESANLSSTGQYIDILGLDLIEVDKGIYKPNIKLKCLFPEGVIETYPETLDIYINFLDKDGFAVQSASIYLKNIGYNEGVWTDAVGVYSDDYKFDITKVKTIAITGYRFLSMKNMTVVYNEDFTFSPSITYEVDDILPSGSSGSGSSTSNILPAENNGSPVAVEQARLVGSSTNFKVNAKIRNMGGTKRDVIAVNFQLLDAQGDVIGSETVYVKDLEPGQGATNDSNKIYDCNYNDVHSIKFISYSYGTFNGGSRNSWTTKAGDGGDFVEPYIFTVG